MRLLIVESPNKVAKISEILKSAGGDWKVAASVGHIRDLPRKERGVESPLFIPQYEIPETKQSVVTKLRGLVKQAEEVYLATDPDREGEAISWHLQEVLSLKKYKRVTFDAINTPVVLGAIRAARAINMNEVKSQEARRVLDRLVGWLVSPSLCKAAGQSNMTAGRVQSPAVRLVVERERDIQKFQVTKHFGAQLSFGDWVANWDTKDFLEAEAKYLLDIQPAQRAALVRSLNVVKSESKTRKRAPPAPFRSATLMQAASNLLKFDPSKTMEIAQSLFAAGHINYHRTDKQNFDDESVNEIRAFARNNGFAVAESVRKWGSLEGAQEGHEAIRPIHLEERECGATADEKALYRLIWVRAIASQLRDAEYSVTELSLESADGGSETFKFFARGRVMVIAGWKSVLDKDDAEDNDTGSDGDDGKVPSLVVGTNIRAVDGRVLEKKTIPPGRFTEASLIAELEGRGIGRPSTYPTIMKNIREREYIVEEARKLKPTPKGMRLVLTLAKAKCRFIEFGFTVELEAALDKIARGEITYLDVIRENFAQIQTDCAKLDAEEIVLYPCPVCKKALVRIENKEKGTFFWGCSTYKETKCSGAMADVEGKPGVRVEPVKSEFICPECSSALINRVKKGQYDFWACSGFPKCKCSFKNVGGKPVFEKSNSKK